MRYKKELEKMMEDNYKSFIIALLSIELNVDDEEKLEEIYKIYMEDDDIYLLDELLIKKIRSYCF